ncbi:MAG: hypothetical protein ABIL16_03350 [candidate division WOR-3 bacterium]
MMIGYTLSIGLFGGISAGLGNAPIGAYGGLSLGSGLYINRMATIQLILAPNLKYPDLCFEDMVRVSSSLFLGIHEIGLQAGLTCFQMEGERSVNMGSYTEIYRFKTGAVGRSAGIYYTIRLNKGKGERYFVGFAYLLPLFKTCVDMKDSCISAPFVSYPRAEFSVGVQTARAKF